MSAHASRWRASAPTNIALIKYMGKVSHPTHRNWPANASLSYTLEHLRSFVELELNSQPIDEWQPLIIDGTIDDFIVDDEKSAAQSRSEAFSLSEQGQAKFLRHLEYLRQNFGFKAYFIVRSVNNFPADCGIASSASSFAALTLAVHQAAADLLSLDKNDLLDRSAICESQQDEDLSYKLSQLSRAGSGSSCRSFFSPWALWQAEGARAITLPFSHLSHQVLLLDTGAKQVSSSQAHQRILTSPNFVGRVARAQQRLAQLLDSLMMQRWQAAYELVRDEFLDMHNLFSTSQPGFSYFTAASEEATARIENLWRETRDGPLITMDAGANVHLLYRIDQKSLARRVQLLLADLGPMLESPDLKIAREFSTPKDGIYHPSEVRV